MSSELKTTSQKNTIMHTTKNSRKS